MTVPSDNLPEHEGESGAVPRGGTGPSETTEGVRASATSPASEIPTLNDFDSFQPLVDDIKARLAELAEREEDLRRREEECAQQQHLLEQFAREAVHSEPDRRVGQAVGSSRGLESHAAELEQQRNTIEEALAALANRGEVNERQYDDVHRRLTEKLDLIRQRKDEVVKQVQTAEAELERQTLVLAREREALDEQIVDLDRQREILDRQAREIEAQAQALEQERRARESAAWDVAERDRQLAARAAEVERREGELDTKEAEARERDVDLEARALEFDQRTEALEDTGAELDQHRESLSTHEAELTRREDDLATRARELDERVTALEQMSVEVEQRRMTLDAREADLPRREEELTSRAREVDEYTAALERTAAEIDESRASLAAQEADLLRRSDNLAARMEEFEQRGEDLEEARAEIDRLHESLATREAELSSRCDDLDARAEDLERRTKALASAAAELDEGSQALAARDAELAGQSSELDTQAAEVRIRTEELDTRARELVQRAEKLDEAVAGFDERGRDLDAREAELTRRRDELNARAEELERRIETLVTATADLDKREQTLARQVAEQQQREDVLGTREGDLETRLAACETEGAAVRARAADVERQQAALESRTAKLETTRAKLKEFARKLVQRKSELAARRADLDDNQRSIHETQESLTRRRKENENREHALNERQTALAEQARQLDEHATALTEQAAGMEAHSDELSQRETEIENRRDSVDKLYQQAAETREHAQLKEREVAEQQERLAAREAKLRRESLQIEVDREHLRHDYTALITEQEKLAQLQLESDEADQARESGPGGETVARISVVSLRRRAAVLSIVMGVAAGLIWFVVEQPRYRGIAEVDIASTRGSLERIASEHADGLTSDAVVEHWQGPPPVQTWTAARATRSVTARLMPDGGKLHLTLDTPSESLAATLLPAAAKAYIAYVDALPLEHFRSPREIEWNERQSALSEELARRRARKQEIEACLAETPLSSERSDAQAAFDEALDGFKTVVERLRGQRGELIGLQSQEPPRGDVSAEVYQQGLAEDALYQEDLKEFASEARQYRTELAVAMVLLADPLQELRKTVRELNTTMVEQRDLQPPPNVRTLLEQCLSEIDDFAQFLAEFAQGWDQRRETIERLKVSEQVVELVNQQNQATDAAGRLVVEARRVLDEVTKRIENLSVAGDAGTREIVVVSVLRGDLSRLSEQVEVLAEAAGATNLAVNFRLDAHDRQLRGLRTRLRNRQERVRQMLQVEADRVARTGRNERERQLRETIGALDDERQTLMDTLVTSLQCLRELDERHRELRQLSAEMKAEESAIVRLEERLERLEAERPELRRDSLTLVESRHEQTAGRNRIRNAGLAGAGVFAATGLMFMLMFASGAKRENETTLT